MLKNLVLALGFLFTYSVSYAATLEFSWQANAAEEQLTGYRIYMDCGAPTCIIAEINNPLATTFSYTTTTKTQHVFSLTAFRLEDDGTVSESGQSTYVIYNPKKLPVLIPRPLNLTVK